MAFKLPKLLPPRKRTAVIFDKNLTDGLPLCKPTDVKRLKTIGRGSYGHISLCQMQGKDYVLKELIVDDADSKKLFLKEARVMNNLNHQNIVKFNSIYKETEIGNHGIIMEYLAFNFEPFGQEFVAHSLRDLLKYIDNYDCEGFEHLHQFVATDVCSGLSYLHDNNIVHRDLKPENILVSNQHYCKENKDISTLWLNKPVVAKLTDFGESRAKLIQTATLVHTRTNNVFRGTPVFMAPEIFFHDGTKLQDLQGLKQMDIWSYSMILFTLLNPDLKYPYHFEYCKEIESGNDRPATEVLKVLFGRRELPCNSTKYQKTRITHWSKIVEAYNRCATFGIRPEMRTIFSFLTKKPENRDGSRNLFTELNDLNEVDGAEEFENAKNIHREHNEEDVPKICSQDHSDNEVVDIEPTELRKNVTECSTVESTDFTLPLSQSYIDRCLNRSQSKKDTLNGSKGPNMCISTSNAIQLSIMGNFHQASPNVFNHDAIGSQCSTMSIVAVIATLIKAKDLWCSRDIDTILKEGNSLHLNILQKKAGHNGDLRVKLI